ncbi:MAG: class I SAM-dependent methyltransferase [Acidimicrobiales bacterium]
MARTLIRRISFAAACRSPRHGCLRSCQSVIDVGCGSGGMLGVLRAQGASPIGVDLSFTALFGASRRFPLVVAHPTALPFRPGSLDGAVLHHVLEHSDEPRRLLCEIAASLRRGGRVRVVVPRADSMLARVLGSWFDGWDVPRHRVHFVESGLVRLLDEVALEVDAVRQFPEPGSVVRSVEHRIGRRAPRILAVASRLALGAVLWAVWPVVRRSSVLDIVARRSEAA